MPRDRGEPSDRLEAADRARERAVEAGERVAALRVRISELKAGTAGPEAAGLSLAAAEARRDDAARRDRVAHDSAARAHDRAADTFEDLANDGPPDRRDGHLRRMDHHRRAAVADRAHGEHPPSDPS